MKIKYCTPADNYLNIPGSPIAYWVNQDVRNAFVSKKVRDFAFVGIGMRTGDNDRFIRYWFEPSLLKVFFSSVNKIDAINSGCKWFPYNKGGEKRRWYGNNEYIVNWENDGLEIKENTRLHYPQLGDNLGWKICNESQYFKPLLTWTFINSGGFAGVRLKNSGFICDVQGSMIVADIEELKYIAGFLCSKVAAMLIDIENPTISIQVKDIATLPLINICNKEIIIEFVTQNIDLSKSDWDSFETSWDFKKHPLI